MMTGCPGVAQAGPENGRAKSGRPGSLFVPTDPKAPIDEAPVVEGGHGTAVAFEGPASTETQIRRLYRAAREGNGPWERCPRTLEAVARSISTGMVTGQLFGLCSRQRNCREGAQAGYWGVLEAPHKSQPNAPPPKRINDLPCSCSLIQILGMASSRRNAAL